MTTLSMKVTRRAAIAGASSLVALPALANTCQIGPTPRAKGPLVWKDMDQGDLDAAYDQSVYAPTMMQITKRYTSMSEATRLRLGQPETLSYGPAAQEKLDLFRTKRPNAPIFVFVHGGAWIVGTAKDYSFPADMFVNAGAHYIAIDFASIKQPEANLQTMTQQVRNAISWVYKNAQSFGGDKERIYVGGHSSGGHLCGVALVTDWQKDFGLPSNIVKGGLCMSGMYDLKPVRLSSRSSYVKMTDEIEQTMSTQRHLNLLQSPVVLSYGSNETPEFQRQSREFAAAVKASGKPVELIEAADFNHFEMGESLGNPYGPNGRAALAMMKL